MLEYWKNKLPADCRSCYDEMLRGFSHGVERVACGSLHPQKVLQTYTAVGRDHPELYALPFNPQIGQRGGFGGVRTEIVITPTYNRAQMRGIDASINAAKAAVVRAAGSAPEEEKERAVCDYILDNTVYAIDNRFNQNAASVLYSHRAQCSGIARAAKLLLDAVGIDSIVIEAEARDEQTGTHGPHSWNLVLLGGNAYHLDVTFMLGANTEKRKPYRYLYFNESDASMRANHIWDAGSVPACPNALHGGTPANASAAPMGNAATRNAPTGNAPANTSPANASTRGDAVSSLYDFKRGLREAIVSGKHSYECYADIPVAEGELMKHIENACKAVLDSLPGRRQVSFSIRGREVKIQW